MHAYRIWQRIAVVGGCLALAACATPRPGEQAVDIVPLPLGRVAIVAARHSAEMRSNANATGKGAAVGDTAGDYVGPGMAGGALAALQLPYTYVVPVILPIAVLGGAIAGVTLGVIEGAWYGLPAGEAKSLQQLIVAALGDAELHEGLARSLARLGEGFPRYRIEHLREGAPAGDDQSVLGVAVTSIGFHAARVRPPAAALQMKASARLVPAGERGEPRTVEFTHTSDLRDVSEWLADDGRLLREQIAVGQFLLADRVAQAVFRAK